MLHQNLSSELTSSLTLEDRKLIQEVAHFSGLTLILNFLVLKHLLPLNRVFRLNRARLLRVKQMLVLSKCIMLMDLHFWYRRFGSEAACDPFFYILTFPIPIASVVLHILIYQTSDHRIQRQTPEGLSNSDKIKILAITTGMLLIHLTVSPNPNPCPAHFSLEICFLVYRWTERVSVVLRCMLVWLIEDLRLYYMAETLFVYSEGREIATIVKSGAFWYQHSTDENGSVTVQPHH